MLMDRSSSRDTPLGIQQHFPWQVRTSHGLQPMGSAVYLGTLVNRSTSHRDV